MRSLPVMTLLLGGCFIGPALTAEVVEADAGAGAAQDVGNPLDAGADAGTPADTGDQPDAGLITTACGQTCAEGQICVWVGDTPRCATYERTEAVGDSLRGLINRSRCVAPIDESPCSDDGACGRGSRCRDGQCWSQHDECSDNNDCSEHGGEARCEPEQGGPPMQAFNGRCLLEGAGQNDMILGRIGFWTMFAGDDRSVCRLSVCDDNAREALCAPYAELFASMGEHTSFAGTTCADLGAGDGRQTCDWYECSNDRECVREYHFLDPVCDDGWCRVGSGASSQFLSHMAHPNGQVQSGGEPPHCDSVCPGGQLCRWNEQNAFPVCATCTSQAASPDGTVCADNRLYWSCACTPGSDCAECGSRYSECYDVARDQGVCRGAEQGNQPGGTPPLPGCTGQDACPNGQYCGSFQIAGSGLDTQSRCVPSCAGNPSACPTPLYCNRSDSLCRGFGTCLGSSECPANTGCEMGNGPGNEGPGYCFINGDNGCQPPFSSNALGWCHVRIGAEYSQQKCRIDSGTVVSGFCAPTN